MKKIYIAYILITMNLTICINIYSQPYKSIFGKENTQWNILTHNLSSWTCVLSTNIDTIVNNKVYKGIIYSGNHCYYSDYKKVFIREDSLCGKAWILDLNLNKERLIMDLSLNVGDTFNIFPNSSIFDTIALVDSVYIENDLKKVRLDINYQFVFYEKLTFIEGIGTNIGIDYQVNNNFLDGFGNTYLLCSYKDNHLVYENIHTDTCYINSVGIKENKLINRLSIYPNPAKDILYVEGSFLTDGIIIIYDIMGNVKKTFLLEKSSNILKIDISSFANGVYFIQVLYNDISVTSKILKQ